METKPRSRSLLSAHPSAAPQRLFACGYRLAGLTVKIVLTAILMLVSSKAVADDHPAATVVPGRLVVVRGYSFRNGDWFAFEPSGLVLFGGLPFRPVVGVVRAVAGVGGSGGGIGLGLNLNQPCDTVDDLAMGPFVTLEGRVERTYGPTSWRSATYVGPQLTLSAYILKASVGWMVDVNDRTDHHIQIGLGGGF
jgi:hypothetical protein